ncbi:hypothetical protein Agub_g3487, partial [Astrephomene gubernaculifera]
PYAVVALHDNPHAAEHPAAAAAAAAATATPAAPVVLVEPQLRALFRVSPATPEYAAQVAALPEVWVGPREALLSLAGRMCTAMALNFRCQGLDVPPWRRRQAVLSRWAAQHCHDNICCTPNPTPLPPPQPLPSEQREQGQTPPEPPTGNAAAASALLCGDHHHRLLPHPCTVSERQQQQLPVGHCKRDDGAERRRGQAGQVGCVGTGRTTSHIHPSHAAVPTQGQGTARNSAGGGSGSGGGGDTPMCIIGSWPADLRHHGRGRLPRPHASQEHAAAASGAAVQPLLLVSGNAVAGSYYSGGAQKGRGPWVGGEEERGNGMAAAAAAEAEAAAAAEAPENEEEPSGGAALLGHRSGKERIVKLCGGGGGGDGDADDELVTRGSPMGRCCSSGQAPAVVVYGFDLPYPARAG